MVTRSKNQNNDTNEKKNNKLHLGKRSSSDKENTNQLSQQTSATKKRENKKENKMIEELSQIELRPRKGDRQPLQNSTNKPSMR